MGRSFTETEDHGLRKFWQCAAAHDPLIHFSCTATCLARVFNSSSISNSSSPNGLIMSKTPFPHVTGGAPREDKPAGLDGERLAHLGAPEAFHENGDWTEEFIVKGEPFQRGLDTRRHDVDREHLAAEEVLEGINNENDRRDFQNPEGEERDRVG